MERNLDFDTVIDRRGVDCLKYDFAVKRGRPANLLPLWVADMDFRTSSYVQDAMRERVDHGIFGYSDVLTDYFEVVAAWMLQHHGFRVQEEWLVKTPGIVYALAMAVKAFTRPGDAVMISQPIYYPFSEVIRDNGRRIVNNPMILKDDGSYELDFEDMQARLSEENVKLYLLCNPHNPVGKVWTSGELTRLADLCEEHGVIIVSDEIHQDFVFRGHHEVLVNLKKEYERFVVTCTSPSKTFNLAGLQISHIFIPNPELRQRFEHEIAASGYSQLNAMGLVAARAAYQYGEEWYRAVHAYLDANLDYATAYINDTIPGVRVRKSEGTYMMWLDFRELGLSVEELESLIVDKAGLWLDSGAIFSEAGAGFQRINIACPRQTLTGALERIKRAVCE